MMRPVVCAVLLGAASAFQAMTPMLLGKARSFAPCNTSPRAMPKPAAISHFAATLDASSPSPCDYKRRRFSLGGAAILLAASSALEPGDSMAEQPVERDPQFPGTSMPRLKAITERVLSLPQSELDGPWPEVRRRLLWAGGLKDMPSTSHAFNDWNHCDLTPMAYAVQDKDNADGAVAGISRQNTLGPYIRAASLSDVGAGGRSVRAHAEIVLSHRRVSFECSPTHTHAILCDWVYVCLCVCVCVCVCVCTHVLGG